MTLVETQAQVIQQLTRERNRALQARDDLRGALLRIDEHPEHAKQIARAAIRAERFDMEEAA